jgi:hypothetical protein
MVVFAYLKIFSVIIDDIKFATYTILSAHSVALIISTILYNPIAISFYCPNTNSVPTK